MEEHSFGIQVEAVEEIQRTIISPPTWKYLKKGYFFTRWFPFHPYKWDETTKGPNVVTGTFRHFFWHLHLLSAIIFYGTLMYKCIQVTVLEPGSKVDQMYALFLTFYYSVFVLLQIHAALKRGEIVNWIRGFFLLTSKCEGTFSQYRYSIIFVE